MGLEYAIDPTRAFVTITGECVGALEWEALLAHALADAENIPIRSFTSYDVALDWLASAGVRNGT